jgi:DNA-binding MarR family transcriptional regulator
MRSAEVEHTAQQLRLVVGQLVRQVRAETGGPTALPVPQAAALGWLDREGPMTTSQLAAVQSVRHQSASRVVNQLVAKHLVVLKPHPTDGRKVVVTVTPTGRRALTRQREHRAEWLADAIATKLSPADQRTLARGVEVMVRLIET